MTYLQTQLANQTSIWPLLIIRIGLGICFILSSWDKLARESYAKSMEFIFNVHWKDAAYDFYQPFLDAWVIPNLEFWAFAVTWGELAIGLAFVFGLFTRFAAISAAFLSLNLLFASGGLTYLRSADIGFLLGSIALFYGCAGRSLGVDSLLVYRSGPPRDWKRFIY